MSGDLGAGMVACWACKEPMHKDASRCPHCQTRRGALGPIARRVVVVIVVLVATLAFVGYQFDKADRDAKRHVDCVARYSVEVCG